MTSEVLQVIQMDSKVWEAQTSDRKGKRPLATEVKLFSQKVMAPKITLGPSPQVSGSLQTLADADT